MANQISGYHLQWSVHSTVTYEPACIKLRSHSNYGSTVPSWHILSSDTDRVSTYSLSLSVANEIFFCLIYSV